MAELERQRVASAQAATTARRFESCCLRHRPVAQRQSSGLRTHAAPVRSGPGRPCSCACCRSHARSGCPRPGRAPSVSRSRARSLTSVAQLDATSFNGRTAGCYPANAGSTPAVAASQPMPRSSNGRGRRSLTPEARVRFPLGVLHSTPSDASGDATRLSAGRGGFDSRRGRSSRRSSVVSTTLLPWRYGGSTPPGETASHG
jgi:hypothetical protein